MKEYMVVFKKKGLPFHEHQRVYAENRKAAIQTVKDQFGSKAVSIVSACLYDNYYK